MQTVCYRFLDRKGVAGNGQCVVASIDELERQLADEGRLLLCVRRSRGHALFGRFMQWRARRHLEWLLVQLVQLLQSGLPLLDALRLLQQGATGRDVRHIAGELAEEVTAGSMLSVAMRRYPVLFQPMLLALIGVGERSGRLVDSLEQARAMIGWQQAIRRRLASALLYPLVSMVMLAAAVFYLLWQIVPSLHTFLGGAVIEASPATRVLLWTSDTLHSVDRRGIGWLVVATPVLVYFYRRDVLRLYRFTPRHIHRLLQRRPRTTLQQAALLRGTAMLYEAGIGLVESLQLNRSHLSSAKARQTIDRVAEAVASGVSLHEALVDTDAVPPLVACLLSTSKERSSVLRGLHHAADGLQRDAEWHLARRDVLLPSALLALLGCVMIVVVSGLVVPLMTVGFDGGILP